MKRNLLLLMSMFVMTFAFAQDIEEPEAPDLEGKTITIGAQAESMEPNTWYLLSQIRGNGGYMYDTTGAQNDGNYYQLYKMAEDNVQDGMLATAAAPFLVRFIPSGTEGAYYVQFGTGRYVINASNGAPTSTDNFYDNPICWTVNLIQDTPSHFYMNVYEEGSTADQDPDYPIENLGSRVDNNGTNGTVAYWEKGNVDHEHGDVSLILDGNYDWSFWAVEFVDADEYEIALTELTNRYQELAEYRDAFEPGTEPGQYDPDAVARFQAAIDAIYYALEEAEDTPTLQQLKDMLAELNESYEAVLASEVKAKFESGYYRFLASMEYYEEVEVVDPETGDTTTETVYPTKAMYADMNQNAKWATLEETAPYLWRVDYDAETQNYKVYNAATDGRFNTIKTSTAVTLSADLDEVESEMEFALIGTDDETGWNYVAFRNAGSTGDYTYAHQGGHSAGAGKSGNIVGWNYTTDSPMGTWWTMAPVDDQTAQTLIEAYGPIKEHATLVANYKEMLAAAKADIETAKDAVAAPLITSVDQFVDCHETEPSEGAIEYMIDGDYSTYWHSVWSSTPDGFPYITVQLADPVQKYTLDIYRRNSGYDHVIKANVYGSNDGEDFELCVEDLEIGEASAGAHFVSDVIDLGAAYTYIKHEFTATANSTSGSDTEIYAHFAEFQICSIPEDNPNSQFNKMGEIGTNLEELVNKEIADDDLTQADYDALKAAYDAFLEKFVDPSILRALIKEVTPKTEVVVEGTDPGFWPAGSSAAQLKQDIADATAYDEAGYYDKATSDTWVEKLNKGVEDLFASANQISTSKWYQIKFPSQTMFEDYGWTMANAEERYDDDFVLKVEALFDRVVAPGDKEEDEDTGYTFARPTEDLGQGVPALFLDEEFLLNPEESWFRFVAVGDTAYALQNKATGLYLRSKGAGAGYATLDVQPTLYTVSALGYGTNLIAVETLDGSSLTNLHAELSTSNCVTWSSAALNTNSTLMIHEVGDVAALPDGKYDMFVLPGKVYPMCYSTEIAPSVGALYTMKGVQKGEEADAIILTPATKANAGQPVIYFAEGEFSADNEDYETAEWTMSTSTEFNPVAGEENGLVGTYSTVYAGKGNAVAKDGGFTLTKATNTAVAANSAYIRITTEAVAAEGDLVITLGGEFNSIEQVNKALDSVAKNGVVYNLAGQVVMENGNINSIRNLGAGVYIINGVKVMVK